MKVDFQICISVPLMPKSKKTMETSLDVTPSFKTSIDARVECLVLNVDYLENRHWNCIQKKCGRKRHLLHKGFVLWIVIFLFVYTDSLHC